MRPVNVRVGHQYYLVVAYLRYVELALFFPYPGAQDGYRGADLLVREHLVKPGLLDVKYFSLEGQNGLVVPVPRLFRGPARRFPLDYVEFAFLGVALLAVGKLPGKRPGLERAFSSGKLLRLSRSVPRSRGLYRLFHYALGNGGIFLKEHPQLFVQQRLDDTPYGSVSELGLGLALKLRVRDLNAHNRHQAFPHVFPGDGHLEVLEKVLLLGVLVYGSRKGGAESREMGSALDVVYVVRVAEYRFPVSVVILEGDFNRGRVPLPRNVDHLGVKRLSVLVELLNESDDSSLVEKLLGSVCPLVVKRDPEALVEKGELPYPVGQYVVIELGDLEYPGIGLEMNLGPAFFRFPGVLEILEGLSLLVFLVPDLPFSPDLYREAFGKRVYNRDADAVETARDPVDLAVELSPGVKHGHHDLNGRFSRLLMDVDRNPPSVVFNRNALV